MKIIVKESVFGDSVKNDVKAKKMCQQVNIY